MTIAGSGGHRVSGSPSANAGSSALRTTFTDTHHNSLLWFNSTPCYPFEYPVTIIFLTLPALVASARLCRVRAEAQVEHSGHYSACESCGGRFWLVWCALGSTALQLACAGCLTPLAVGLGV